MTFKETYDFLVNEDPDMVGEIFQSVYMKINNATKSTKEDDIHKHIDCKLPNGLRVDVKAPKKRNRYDKDFDLSSFLVEFKNVRGNDGWLFGEADIISLATVIEDKWVFIDVVRQMLYDYIKKWYGLPGDDIQQKPDDPKIGVYYQRENRDDVFIYIDQEKFIKKLEKLLVFMEADDAISEQCVELINIRKNLRNDLRSLFVRPL